MHGLGNDYVFVDCLEQKLSDPAAVARKISRRRFSVGADGLILILPSKKADFQMEIYNADGSQGEMCGNGIRCLGKYVYEHQKAAKKTLTVETKAGIRRLALQTKDERVVSVRVDMGVPDFHAQAIPAKTGKRHLVRESVSVDGTEFSVTCLSMGNPHCVIFEEEIATLHIEHYGNLLEHHPLFPERTNVEFVQVVNESQLSMRVWERGSEETMACGTGACAAVCAAVVNGYAARHCQVTLPGGTLQVYWSEWDNHVYLSGPAEEVFTGSWDEDSEG